MYPQIFSVWRIFSGFALGSILLVAFYKNKPMMVFGFSFIFFILGFYLVEVRLEKIKKLDLNGKKISGLAMVIREPEQKEKYKRLVVRAEKIPSAKILVNAFDKNDYRYGDKIELECALEIPKKFSTDFDYQMYLAKDGIFYECQKPKINFSSGEKMNDGNEIYAGILFLKNKFNRNIEKLIPFPEAGLASGLVVGGSDLLSSDVQNDFSRTGLAHIVAVSGYNVTIVAEYLMMLGIFLGLWRRQAFWFAAIGIFLFVLLVGFPSSAVRAGVMGILLIWAMKNGRLANSQNAVIFSAAFMLLLNPLLLRWDIGFQLSFLATLGIVYLYPFFESSLVKNHKALGVSEILFLSVSAQIFVLPVILFNFGNLSLISPLANILVLPIVPIAMLLVFLSVVSNFVFHPLGMLFSWLAYLPLKYETFIIRYLASLKYASMELKLSWWGVAVWYAILFAVLKYTYVQKKIDL